VDHEVKIDELKYNRLKDYSTTFWAADLPAGYPQLPYQKGDTIIFTTNPLASKTPTPPLRFIVGDLYYFPPQCIISLLKPILG
jgi:hypothetical protein